VSVAYKVVAPLVLVKDDEGVTHHAYQGAVLENLGAEQVDHLLGLGFIAKLGSDDAVVVPGNEFLDEDQIAADALPVEVEQPPKAARHDLWVDYAVSKGADRTEAESLTKAELIELYG
jgi:hypothetical protein